MVAVQLENTPSKVRTLFEKGLAAMERGNLDYAIEMFLSALTLEPQLLKARKFLRAAEAQQFKQSKTHALTHHLSTLRGLSKLVSANILLKTNPERAMVQAEQLLKIDPFNLFFIRLLVKAAQLAHLPEVAIQTLEIASNYYTQNTSLLHQLATAYLHSGETRKARESFEKLVQHKPNDSKIIKALKDATALDTMQQGGWESAESYRDVIHDTQASKHLEQEAKSTKSASALETLIEQTRATIQADPSNTNHKRILADLYSRAHRFEEARNLLTTLQSNSGTGDAQIGRAITKITANEYDACIATLQAAGDTHETELKQQEKKAFLLADANTRVVQYPNDLQGRYELALLLFENGAWNDAIQQLQRSQKNPQRRISSLYHLARCFKEKKQYDIAIEQLEQAASELPTMDAIKKDIFYELGLTYELIHNNIKATEYFKDIYAVDIGYKDVALKIEKAYES